MAYDEDESQEGYERIGSWDVRLDLPEELRESLREEFTTISERASAGGNMSFFRHQLIGSSMWLPPNPFVAFDSYMQGEPRSTYDEDVAMIQDGALEINLVERINKFNFESGEIADFDSLISKYVILSTVVGKSREMAMEYLEGGKGSPSDFARFCRPSIEARVMRDCYSNPTEIRCDDKLGNGAEVSYKIVIGVDPMDLRIEPVE